VKMSRLKTLTSLFLFLILVLLFPELAAGADNLLVWKSDSHVALQTPVVCVNSAGRWGWLSRSGPSIANSDAAAAVAPAAAAAATSTPPPPPPPPPPSRPRRGQDGIRDSYRLLFDALAMSKKTMKSAKKAAKRGKAEAQYKRI
jgi:hypothetical protein